MLNSVKIAGEFKSKISLPHYRALRDLDSHLFPPSVRETAYPETHSTVSMPPAQQHWPPLLLADPRRDNLRGPAGSSLSVRHSPSPASESARSSQCQGLWAAPCSQLITSCPNALASYLPSSPQLVSPFRRDHVSLISLSPQSLAQPQSEHTSSVTFHPSQTGDLQNSLQPPPSSQLMTREILLSLTPCVGKKSIWRQEGIQTRVNVMP